MHRDDEISRVENIDLVLIWRCFIDASYEKVAEACIVHHLQ